MTYNTAEPATSTAQAAKKDATPDSTAPAPIVIDMGKKTRKQIRKLRKGEPGRLMNRVEEAVEHLRENGVLAASAQPIVVVIKERARRRGKRISKMWGLG